MNPQRIWIKRAYQAPGPADGCRILVDRIWPRGISRDALQAELWCREVAPSTALRQWFDHDPRRWNGFRERYFDELRRNADGVGEIRARLARGRITLLFGARDVHHNQAVALREFLLRPAP